MHRKIKRKIPMAQLTAMAAPSIASVLGFLQAQFDEDNLDHDDEDVELSLDRDDKFSDTEDQDDLPLPS